MKHPRLVLTPARQFLSRIPESKGVGRFLLLRVDPASGIITDSQIVDVHQEAGGMTIEPFTHYARLGSL